MNEEKRRESRLRSKLTRRGYRLKKNRVRDERALGYKGYMIADIEAHFIVAGAVPYNFFLSLDDVEDFIKG